MFPAELRDEDGRENAKGELHVHDPEGTVLFYPSGGVSSSIRAKTGNVLRLEDGQVIRVEPGYVCPD